MAAGVRERAAIDRAAWDAAVDVAADGWFWHRSGWLDYCLAYRPGAVDHSFAIVVDQRIRALCPLIQEGDAFTMGGEPGSGWLSWDVDASAAMQAEAERRVAASGARRLLTRQPGTLSRGRLFGWHTRVVPTTDPDAAWRGVRKSYRQLVKQQTASHRIDVGTDAAVDGYCDVHWRFMLNDAARVAAEAGIDPARVVVRQPATYALQRAWARDGYGLAVTAYDGDTAVAAAYAIIDKGRAYYASGPSTSRDAMHGVIWRLIQACAERGVAALEMGWVDRHDDDKNRQIAFFKRGFGGTDEVVHATELEVA